ncbi:uncharacterized protein LOC135164025 [Diachasmimorpha longicaudata]|uniref:uncharacterized protein LOC135164025 n=1 Tax=Diachasmimorpha longicaudata TaxID=58733 RepID=UPI0030B8823C
MFTRRLRVLLKLSDKQTFLRSSRDYVEPNLKFSTISSFQSLQIRSGTTLKRSIFSSEKIEGYSNLSQTSDQPECLEEEDPSQIHPTHGAYRMTENRRAYLVLENNPRYKKTVIPRIIPDERFPEETIKKILRKEWTLSSNVSDIIESFRILSYDARSHDKRITDEHTPIFEKLTSVVKDLVTDQIWQLLRYVEMWYPMATYPKSRALTALEDALDNECYKRSLEWDADDLLKTCDLFYHLRRSRQSKFTGFALKKLGLKPCKMSSDNYIHYMYLLNVGRKPWINMYELEYRLEGIVEEFTTEELAIIAMGFFKTATPIRNPALSGHIVQKCVNDMKDLDEIFISAIMKMARLSVHLRDRDILRNLFHRFKIRIDTISTPCLVHTAHTAATTLIFEKEVMDLIMNELIKRDLSGARLKDIERLLFSLMIFNYPKDFPLYELAINQLKNPVRTSERNKFAVTYICCLMYLSHMDIYPLDIITNIMDPQYLKDVYRNNAFKIGREYLTLECGLKVEVPEYQGPFLPERVYNYLAKRYASDVVWREDPSVRVQTYQKFLFEVVHYLKTIVGENNYFMDQVLPQHQRADIILCVDVDNNFISAERMLLECPTFTVKFAPERLKYRWFAMTLASHNQLFRGSSILSGTSNAKLRQLTKAGYTPITVMLPTWTNLKEAERHQYLRNLVTQHINNKEYISS